MSCRQQTKLPSKALLQWKDGRVSRLAVSKIKSERSEIAVGKEVQAWWSDEKDLHSCQILYLHGKHISFFLGHLFLNTRTMYTMSSCIPSFKLQSFIFPKNYFHTKVIIASQQMMQLFFSKRKESF